MFEHIEAYPGDPILSLLQAFLKEERANKVNLGIGLYYDENGKIPRLQAIAQAEKRVAEQPLPCSYLPMEGSPLYRQQVQALLFGADAPLASIATLQTLGGSGALRVGADFLKRYFPKSSVWVSDPTWDNHLAIFEGSGFSVSRYPYFSGDSQQLDFSAMLNCINELPAESIVLLHPCCHNPTGMDLTQPQWDQLITLLIERRLIPFLDMAYQGLGNDFAQDAYAIQALLKRGANFLISNSFSKIFSLYGERCGALSVICQDKQQADRVLGQLQATIRRNYSSPPTHGSRLITTVLEDQALHQLWQQELTGMRERIKSMRHALFEVLSSQNREQDFNYLLTQRGMFSYTGLTVAQIAYLREKHAIYLVDSGRMCVAGLNQANAVRVAHAFADALRSA